MSKEKLNSYGFLVDSAIDMTIIALINTAFVETLGIFYYLNEGRHISQDTVSLSNLAVSGVYFLGKVASNLFSNFKDN